MPNVRTIIDDYEALLAGAPAAPALPPVDRRERLIAINYTSGTTGFPKGVMFTHRGAWVNAIGEIIEHGLDARSVYLWTLPLFHCNGWCFTWAVTAAGGRHVCLPRPDPREAVAPDRSRGRHAPLRRSGGGGVADAVLRRRTAFASAAAADRDRGRAAPPAVIRAAEETGAELTHVYGLTETYGPHTICAWKPEWDTLPPNERAQLKARQGVRLPGRRHGSARGGPRTCATSRAMATPWARCSCAAIT